MTYLKKDFFIVIYLPYKAYVTETNLYFVLFGRLSCELDLKKVNKIGYSTSVFVKEVHVKQGGNAVSFNENEPAKIAELIANQHLKLTGEKLPVKEVPSFMTFLKF